MRTRIAGIAITFLMGTLCIFFSCSTKKTSSSPTSLPSPSTNMPLAKETLTATPQNQEAQPFTYGTEFRSSKYHVKVVVGGFGVLDEKGNLTDNATRINGEMWSLVQESDQLDLGNAKGLSAFGNQIGQQLKMTDKDTIILSIKAARSGKMLFVGELKPNGDGKFELHAKSFREQ